MASSTIPTDALPNASMGCRTVVRDGTESPAGITSSKPITRAILGNFSSRRAPIRELHRKRSCRQNAITAVKRFLCFKSSSISFEAALEARNLGPAKSGKSTTRPDRFPKPTERANERTPRNGESCPPAFSGL